MPWNTIKCGDCGRDILAPFKPSSDRMLRCPTCQIMNTNMTKTQYVKYLITFLNENLVLEKGSKITAPLRRARSTRSLLILEKKGEEPKPIVTIDWTPIDNNRLLLPQMAVADIKAKKPEVKEIIKAFIKKYGVESSIPPPLP